MIPYTYVIVNKITGQKYYGARWSKNCHPSDLWVTYFTSSKHVKKLISEHGQDSFIVEVRKTFTTIESCREWERKVLIRLNILKRDDWLNKNINGKFLPCGAQSAEHIAKRIRRGPDHHMYGKPSPNRGKKVPEHIRAKQRGPKTPEHVANMKCHSNNSMSVECPHCNKVGQLTNMKRWHFDRCKHNPNRVNDLEKLVTCSVCGHTSISSPNFYRYHNENCNHDQSV